MQQQPQDVDAEIDRGTQESNGRLAKMAAAFRKALNDRGLSGEVVVSCVIDGGITEVEVGWSLSMDGREEGGSGGKMGDVEKAAMENVDSFMEIATDVKRKAFTWRIPLSLTLTLHILWIKFEITLEVSPFEEERKNQLEAVLAADWGHMTYSETNQFVVLKSHLIHRDGKPVNDAISKWNFVRRGSLAFDGLKSSVVKSARAMEAAGYHGAIKAGVVVKVPTALTGVKTLELGIAVQVELQKLIAAEKIWEEDHKNRSTGMLNCMAKSGQGIPVMDIRTSDPYLIFAIEGGRKEDRRRTKTCKSTLEPNWEELCSPMPCAKTGETLIVTLFDENTVQSDKFIDEWVIPLDKLELVPGQPRTVVCPLKGKKADESSVMFSVWWNTP